MPIVDCTEARHAAPMLEILNDAILHSTAVYDFHPRAPSAMGPWFAIKRQHGLPVLGLEDEHGRLLGFASYGSFRAWPAYKYSVEHSIYVRHDQRGRGLGRQLLGALVAAAQARDVHLMVGGIDADNQASIGLHLALGFTHAGTIRHAGFKFGRWLDLAFYQRILPTPQQPVEG